MSRFIEHLTERRYSYNAVAAKLDRVKARKPGGLFIVVEAIPDKVVFSRAAKSVRETDVVPVLCDGKRGVLRLLNYVRQKYGKDPGILFFVDRDLDDFLDGNVIDDFLYVTDGYSIENDFISPTAFHYILSDVYSLDEDDEVLTKQCERFEKALDEFAEVMLPLMAWVVEVRALGGNLNLNNIQLAEIVDLSDIYLPKRRKGALKAFHNSCAVNLSLKNSCGIKAVLKKFEEHPSRNLVRGKYLLWFFTRFLSGFKLELQAAQKAGERHTFMNVEIDDRNIFQLLSGLLPAPNSLRVFLTMP
jgi:hypothetical protein